MQSRLFGAGLALTLGVLACARGSNGSTDESDLTMADLPVKLTAPWEAGVFTQLIDHGTDGNAPFAAPAAVTDAGAATDASTSAIDADGGAAPDQDAGAPDTTFGQRYWINRSFAKSAEAPVLFYLCGEEECDADYGVSFADSARVLGAAIVVLEHRYYGESIPFGTPDVSELRFLTIHNALEDAAAFERHAKESLGLGGKWIVAGGSYPGALAAFYRLKHPELVVGAWASSAPIQLVGAFPGYDALAARTLGPSCSLLVRQAQAAVPARLADPARRIELVQRAYQVSTTPSWVDTITAGKLTRLITGTADQAAQYGNTAVFCSSLVQHEDDPLEGFLAFRSPLLADDPVETPADADAGAAADGGATNRDATAAPLTPGGSRPAPAMPAFADYEAPAAATAALTSATAWTYQTCAEFGCFPVYNPDRTQSVATTEKDEASYMASCRQKFGVLPNHAGIRATYADPIVAGQASNILFVNGDQDPWSALSLNDPASAPAGIDVFVIRGGSHCDDLGSLYPGMAAGVYEAHKKFVDLARKWLAE